MTVIQDIEDRQRREVPQFKAGDTVRVHFKVIEGTRSRVQVFEGICIKRQDRLAYSHASKRRENMGLYMRDKVVSIDTPCAGAHRTRTISVADHGPGMPPEVKDKAFEAFFTTKHRGTGLGLPTARRIAEAHGGRIELGEATGGGTVVSIKLPAAH